MVLVYVIKWAVALTILYSLFGLLLRKETYYAVNRCVLIGIMVLSALLPLMHFTVEHEGVVHQVVSIISHELTLSPAHTVQGSEQAPTTRSILPIVLLISYVVGAVAFAVRYLLLIAKVCRIIGRSRKENDYYINNDVASPFSWFSFIVISETDLRDNGKALLAHEKAHVKCRHSYDHLLCDVCTCLQWWNPFVWMLRNDLCAVHEYEADHIVTHCADINDFEYKVLLIKKATESYSPSIVNGINHTSLKERLRQMYRKPSTHAAILKVLYVVPLSVFVTFCFAKPKVVDRIEAAIVQEEAALIDKAASVISSLHHTDSTQTLTSTTTADAEPMATVEQEPEPIVAAGEDNRPRLAVDGTPCVYDVPSNANGSIYFQGVSIERLASETHVVCVGTCESDDVLLQLGGDMTYIEDVETGDYYKARHSLTENCWGSFHVMNQKGKTFALTVVFPPLADDVKTVRFWNLCNWLKLDDKIINLSDYENL